MYCKNCGEPMNENQAICLKCGVPTGKGTKYCANCGNEVAEEAVICVKCGVSLGVDKAEEKKANTDGIKKRSLVSAIIFTIITCGIYSIFWFISLTNDMNKASGRVNDTNGGMAFLFSIITCGIYSYIWAYKLGEKRDIVANEKSSSNIVYLLLTLFGLGIVVYAMAQDTLNKAVDAQ